MTETNLITALLERLEIETNKKFNFCHTIKTGIPLMHYVSVFEIAKQTSEIQANGDSFNKAYRILTKKLNDLKLIENWSYFMLHNLTTS